MTRVHLNGIDCVFTQKHKQINFALLTYIYNFHRIRETVAALEEKLLASVMRSNEDDAKRRARGAAKAGQHPTAFYSHRSKR